MILSLPSIVITKSITVLCHFLFLFRFYFVIASICDSIYGDNDLFSIYFTITIGIAIDIYYSHSYILSVPIFPSMLFVSYYTYASNIDLECRFGQSKIIFDKL